MMMHGLMVVIGLAGLGFRRGAPGLWQSLHLYLAGRSAVALERERRATLVALAESIPPGTIIRDYRPGGVATIVQSAQAASVLAAIATKAEE
jgi:hypothetical protein